VELEVLWVPSRAGWTATSFNKFTHYIQPFVSAPEDYPGRPAGVVV
jgi:hypothetical protein